MLIIGVDDAGRGPVVGPMVLAGVLVDKKQEAKLRKLGVKDSKQVLPKKREKLAKEIKKIVKAHKVSMFSAAEINKMMSSKINLNVIEAISVAKVINYLVKNKLKNKIKVIIDCPSVNTSSWLMKVKEFLKTTENLSFVCEHKADLNYVSVAAASILAKVARDEEIEKIKKKVGIDFGSGYPADPKTIKFLDEHYIKFRNLGIFREHWKTIKNLRAGRRDKRNQKKLFDY